MAPSDGWRKSSRSGSQGNNCVEARKSAGYFQIRDSKLGDDSPIFDMTPADFQALMKAAKR
ncbi:hypothetical protein GCM10029992_04940 [Glycomyces albus]